MKTMTVFVVTAMAALTMLNNAAQAEQERYTCRAGALTITSTSPCYATLHGISVPGKGDIDKEGKKDSDGGGKKGGNFGGPKDFADKPKGGGFGGPKNVKDKD
ncbi:MAG: hypothetical protein HYU58_07805 [Proteobacteria bacterium]|nr:hypothetical protein [Pseudomonadota bacterium]